MKNQQVVVTLNETVQENPVEASDEDTVNFTITGKPVKFGESGAYVLSDGSLTYLIVFPSFSKSPQMWHILTQQIHTVKIVSQPSTNDTLVIKVTLTKDGQPIEIDLVIKFDNPTISLFKPARISCWLDLLQPISYPY